MKRHEKDSAMANDQHFVSSAAAQVAGIDFSKYRTGDLAEHLVELMSVPSAFRRVIRSAALVIVLAAGTCALIVAYSEMTRIPLLAVCSYSLLMGVVLGIVLGMLRVLAKALQNVESILTTLLELTDRVAQDYDQVRTKSARLPTAGELVEQVYERVAVPVMERAVMKGLGFLSTPVLWCYRRTLGSAVHSLVKRVNRRMAPLNDGESNVTSSSGFGTGPMRSYSESISRYTVLATQLVAIVGRSIHRFVIAPLYLLFVVSLASASLPILIVRYVTKG